MSEDQNKTGHTGAILGALAAGVVAGAIGGILFAPKSGEETRADISEVAGKMKDDIVDRLSEVGEVTSEAYHDVVDAVVGKYEEAKSITAQQAGELKKELSKNYEKVKETVEKNAQ